MFHSISLYVVRCAICYHLYNLKNVKNTHGEVLILVKDLIKEASKKAAKYLILAFWSCLTYEKMPRIKFAELKKKPKINRDWTIVSLNVSLWIILWAPLDILNHMDT